MAIQGTSSQSWVVSTILTSSINSQVSVYTFCWHDVCICVHGGPIYPKTQTMMNVTVVVAEGCMWPVDQTLCTLIYMFSVLLLVYWQVFQEDPSKPVPECRTFQGITAARDDWDGSGDNLNHETHADHSHLVPLKSHRQPSLATHTFTGRMPNQQRQSTDGSCIFSIL